MAQDSLLEENHLGRAMTLKKMVYVHLQLYQYEEALHKLRSVVHILESGQDDDDDEPPGGDNVDDNNNNVHKKNNDHDRTKELLRVLEEHAASPHPWDDGVVALRRMMLSSSSSSSSSNNNSNNSWWRRLWSSCEPDVHRRLDPSGVRIPRPRNRSKMTGHQVRPA